MIYFLDTNIFIGYVFFEDLWHDKSLEIFKHNHLYWSTTVKKEFIKKFTEFYNITYNYIKKIEITVLNYNFNMISLKNFNRILDGIKSEGVDYRKKIRILKRIWENITECEEYISKNNLLEEIMNYRLEIRNLYFLREKEIKNFLTLYFPNSHVYRLIDKLKGIHYPDNKIILDAHDLACNKRELVYFISADKKLCNIANSFDFLKIKKFIYLGNFN